MYSLFYNYKLLGDILFIIFDNEKIPNNVVKEDNVTKIYYQDNLIGVNIFNFSKIIKIKANGLIPLPNKELINVINSILSQHNIDNLPYKEESGFKIGKILSVEEHPESDHLHILKVDIGSEILDIVCGAYNVKVDAIVVVATLGTTMFDGSVIKKGKLLGVESNGMCCSEKELNLTDDQTKRGLLILDDTYKIGSDFFAVI